MKTYYHFTNDNLRDGTPIPETGKWLTVDTSKRPLELCRWGLHASERVMDALKYAPGAILHKVEVSGEILRADDKICAERRRIVATSDATDILRRFARRCALDVIHLWDAPDVVVEYLKTGDESLRVAARDAARDAARAAAWDAARAAAWNAARAAAWNAARAAARDAAWTAALAAARAKHNRRLAQMVAREFNK